MENNEMLQAMQQTINQLETTLTAAMNEQDQRLMTAINALGDRLSKLNRRLKRLEMRLEHGQTKEILLYWDDTLI